MIRHGMLTSESDELVSPELAELNYTYLKTTAGILEPQFQYFGVGLSLIANLEKGVDLDDFWTAVKLSGGSNEPFVW